MSNMYSKYLDLGWSVFPIQYKGKRPLFSWSPYQEEHATPDEVDRWLTEYSPANVAVATGAVSGIVVVDIDSDEGRANLEQHGFMPKTPYQRTGKGEHHFFAYPGLHIGNKAAFVPGVDLRADGGYVVVAPSVHPSGAKYEWVVSPADCELAEMPEWLVRLVRPKQPERINALTGEIVGDANAWLEKALSRAVVGTRDETAFWLACQLRDNGVAYGEAEGVLKQYAASVPTGNEAYTEREAIRKVRSAWSKPARSPATSQRQTSVMDTTLYAEEAWQDRAEKMVQPQERRDNGDQPKSHTPSAASPMFVTSDQIYNQLIDELLGDTSGNPDLAPYDFPCKAIHHLGGFAKYAWPAKMVYVCGGSGFLKTTFIEFLQDNLLRAGYDFVHYGPEWTPDEMGIRGVQRYDGVTLDDMAAHRVFVSDEYRAYTPERGQRLSHQQVSKSLGIIGERLNWPGRGYYIPSAALSFKELIQSIVAAVEDSRSRGRQCVAVFGDYLEIMRRFSAGGGDAFWGERIATVFKNISIEYGFTMYLLLQAKKGEADRVLDAGAQGVPLTEVLLGPASAQGMSNQQCNLYITLNPRFDENRKLDGNMLLNVCKNSGGETGVVDIKFNPSLLQFMDRQ